jgi:hypothetical protein
MANLYLPIAEVGAKPLVWQIRYIRNVDSTQHLGILGVGGKLSGEIEHQNVRVWPVFRVVAGLGPRPDSGAFLPRALQHEISRMCPIQTSASCGDDMALTKMGRDSSNGLVRPVCPGSWSNR